MTPAHVRFSHFTPGRPHREGRLPAGQRRAGWDEVNAGLRGTQEASRCFSCGSCTSCDTCLLACPEGIIRRREDGRVPHRRTLLQGLRDLRRRVPAAGDGDRAGREAPGMTVELLSGNHAAAIAAALAGRANRRARGFVSGVYPITPSTECIELLCAHEIEKGQVVRVESEHSAMGVCIGAAAAGARTFTATSSNGLVYMAENVFAAAQLPPADGDDGSQPHRWARRGTSGPTTATACSCATPAGSRSTATTTRRCWTASSAPTAWPRTRGCSSRSWCARRPSSSRTRWC